MKTVYLDNSATTPLCSEAREKMIQAMDCFGNPSSLHAKGFEASKLLNEARNSVLNSLFVRGGKAENLVFTSSGTEADNLAIRGVAYAKSRRATRIITTDSEHSAIENTLRELEKEGFEIIRIPTRAGLLDMNCFYDAMNKNTLLVTMMHVNNETGALYNIRDCFKYAKSINPDVVTHTDAVQSYMKTKVSPSDLFADLITVSSHKIHGPKGVGALYISSDIIKKKQISPIIYGGGQEGGIRSGTENVIGIAGFGAAAERDFKHILSDISIMNEIREYAISKLSTLDLKINIPSGKFAPHIISITLPSIKSETMLHHLSSYGIYVSSGSACASNSASKKISRSLSAFGLSDLEAECTLRISLSAYNTKDDIDLLALYLAQGIEKLVKINKR